MIVFELFFECVLLSFVAFGGATALLPELHRVVVILHPAITCDSSKV